MTDKVKIVMIGINFACLFQNLQNPSQVTPFSVLPVIVTSTSWVFIDKNSKILTTVLLIGSTIIGIMCFLIGINMKINSETLVMEMIDSGKPVLVNFNFDYKWFAYSSFFYYFVLTIADIIVSQRIKNNPKDIYIDKEIKESLRSS